MTPSTGKPFEIVGSARGSLTKEHFYLHVGIFWGNVRIHPWNVSVQPVWYGMNDVYCLRCCDLFPWLFYCAEIQVGGFLYNHPQTDTARLSFVTFPITFPLSEPLNVVERQSFKQSFEQSSSMPQANKLISCLLEVSHKRHYYSSIKI